MKVTPIAAAAPQQVQTVDNSQSRARAIQMLTQAAPTQEQSPEPARTAQEHPVADANNISAEELSAIKAPQAPEITDKQATSEATEEVEAQKAPPAKDPALERQFQELARQERILRAKANKQAQEFRAREEAIKAQEAALGERGKQYDTGYLAKDRFKSDPLGALAEAGLTYEELTQQVLTQQPRDPRLDSELNALRNEIKALRSANEDAQKSYKDQQAESYQAAVKQIHSDVTKLVASEGEAYEAIAKTGSVKDVVELIEQTYAKDGVLLSVEEAAQEVENYLVEQGLSTLSRIEKIKKRLVQPSAPAKQVDQQQQAKPQQSQPTQMKTLTNAASSTRKLSARERALLAFKGELKG